MYYERPHQYGSCPNCGYCPHCGRGRSFPSFPEPPKPYSSGLDLEKLKEFFDKKQDKKK